MANKNWDYIIVYIRPSDLIDKTPAKRREVEHTEKHPISATSVKRAISKATSEIMGVWGLTSAKDVIIVDCVRDQSPLFG